jgi:hypothetical protein
MRSSAKSIPPTPPPPIDLSLTTEATRRQLYDIAVAVHFSPTEEEIREARRTEEWYPRYSVDESGLAVIYLAGRWFVYWRVWDAGDDAPEDQEWEILRAETNAAMPYGVEFYEI